MTTKLQRMVVKVRWQYSPDKIQTTCFLDSLWGDKSSSISSGTATKSKKDQFEYEKARKTSLKRALAASDLNKEERGEIWIAYFARKQPKVYDNGLLSGSAKIIE
jgi:hypothetical protein